MTEEEILARIAEIEKDERYLDDPASILINAPLALVQISLETERSTLKKVIGA